MIDTLLKITISFQANFILHPQTSVKMRLTPKFLVKVFVCVILVFFVFPMLLNKLDSKEDEKAEHNRKRKNIVKKVKVLV